MQHLAVLLSLNSSHDKNLNLGVGGYSFQSWKIVAFLVEHAQSFCVCQRLCSSKYRRRTSIWGTVTCLFPRSHRWDGDLISPRGWAGRAGRAGLTSLTSPLRDQHLRVMRATASVTHFNFLLSPLLSILSREPFSVFPFHPPPLPPFFFFCFLILFLSLLRKQFEAKDAWLRATREQSALICCFALWAVKTCGQDRVGRKEEWRRGKEKQSGNELNCDLGKGYGGREKKLS